MWKGTIEAKPACPEHFILRNSQKWPIHKKNCVSLPAICWTFVQKEFVQKEFVQKEIKKDDNEKRNEWKQNVIRRR